jgi:hypothetical protein
MRTPNCGLLPEDIEAAIAFAVAAPSDVASPVCFSPAHTEFPSQIYTAIGLLGILSEQLQSFQAGSHVCREVALAIERIDEARHWLWQGKLVTAPVRQNVAAATSLARSEVTDG